MVEELIPTCTLKKKKVNYHQLERTISTLSAKNQFSVAQRAEMTLDKCSLKNCVRVRFTYEFPHIIAIRIWFRWSWVSSCLAVTCHHTWLIPLFWSFLGLKTLHTAYVCDCVFFSATGHRVCPYMSFVGSVGHCGRSCYVTWAYMVYTSHEKREKRVRPLTVSAH